MIGPPFDLRVTVQPSDPLSIFGSGVVQYNRADLGVTLSTGVSGWADQSGNAAGNWAQSTAGSQPTYSASDPSFNGQPSITGDGVDDSMSCALTLPQAGTTPTTLLMVLRVNSWSSNSIIEGSTGSFMLQNLTSATVWRPNNGSPPTLAYATGNTYRHLAEFSNQAGDRHKLGTVSTTGNAGNNASVAGRQLFGRAASLFVGASVAELVRLNRLATAQELADYDAYVSARYGAII